MANPTGVTPQQQVAKRAAKGAVRRRMFIELRRRLHNLAITVGSHADREQIREEIEDILYELDQFERRTK